MVSGTDVVSSAQTWVTAKVPYVWGGATKLGADCSGFVQNVLTGLGVTGVGRTVGQQATEGTSVAFGSATNPLANAQPGDVLIFGNTQHEGIYVGNGQMIDEPHSGAVATQRNVWFGGNEPLTGIRRFTAASGTGDTTVATPVSLSGDISGAISGATGSAASDTVNALLKPFASLGGSTSLQESMTRGTLIVFGAILIIVALHAFTSNSATPIGVATEGGAATVANAKKVTKRTAEAGATAAVVH